MSETEIWGFRPTSGHLAGSDLVGFQVEATDGHIGKIDRHSDEAAASYLVVDTGPWIFGHLVLLPAGTVVRIDHQEQRVYVDRTKAEIKDGPRFLPEELVTEPDIRDRYSLYYGPFYGPPNR
ncbi:hypothetical protein CFP65_7072 [Kitasatospora sp. MMS16-BH015]|uniref:PRC-barrel domain-containing protein n=1 Tax=Kitasatospora sp. MMS16-BH015 TaxID=2018025 RepID=UPI000CA1F739|nr:PRC-barrel domain-containing protein [Kitasatospora sp. MMS16-BH015]AUG81677.1 hypothetical protein CFP65_7072 [Kitasatospora sp. MMS16-BH015]